MSEKFPKLSIRLKPWLDGEANFRFCDVEMELEEPDLQEGEILAWLIKEVAWVPRSEFTEAGLQAFDSVGRIELQQNVEDVEGISAGSKRDVWRVARPTKGSVRLTYRYLPRDLTGINRCHPLLDVIQEENGAILCGATTLVIVPDRTYHIHVSWDSSEMPEGARIEAAMSEEAFSFTGKPMDYIMMILIAGRYQCISEGDGKYKVLWLDQALPDEERVRRELPPLIKTVFQFFHDEERYYRVIFRKEPFEISNSGTAFPYSFVYGYSDAMPLSMDTALNVLTHEAVHNWTNMESKRGEGSWYNEGIAEYYSLMIPLRKGIVDSVRAAEWLTQKSINYYNNPYQDLSLCEANEKTWKDRNNNQLQRVPYGRGFFYLADVDYQVKKQTDGEKSLDDMIFPFAELAKKGMQITNADWEKTLGEYLGEEAVTQFREVMEGKYMPVNSEWFDGAFTFEKGLYESRKEGRFEDALIWKAKGAE